eukprot:231822-Prymnesium_polylepis.1
MFTRRDVRRGDILSSYTGTQLAEGAEDPLDAQHLMRMLRRQQPGGGKTAGGNWPSIPSSTRAARTRLSRRFTVTFKLSFGWPDVVTLGSIQGVARSESMGCVPACPEHRRTSPKLHNGHFLAGNIAKWPRSPLSTTSALSFRPMVADLRGVAQSSSGNSLRPHCPL